MMTIHNNYRQTHHGTTQRSSVRADCNTTGALKKNSRPHIADVNDVCCAFIIIIGYERSLKNRGKKINYDTKDYDMHLQ